MDSIQKSYLVETARWQKVIGILMAIGTVFLAVGGIFFLIFGDAIDTTQTAELGGVGARILGALYLVMAIPYFFFTRFLLRSAKCLKIWGLTDDEVMLSTGLKNTKSYFKFTGILALVGIALVFIVIIVGAVVTAMKVV